MNIIITVFAICNGNIALGFCTDIEAWSVLKDLGHYLSIQIETTAIIVLRVS